MSACGGVNAGVSGVLVCEGVSGGVLKWRGVNAGVSVWGC